ncbi:uncharacterized protein LOC115455079 isoform X2 [Manduca sexta]|uniref:uncharacterized protein LOC115455079 isoform X2 n=2 Tax=Manduca sexta TaxID=7130 RepID=UPI00188E592D|nr:uncharacterized protein LOC115455079 isoform X2 [Manduca sexta]
MGNIIRYYWQLIMEVSRVDGAPEPCFGLLNSRHYHYYDTHTEAPTTKRPTEKEEVTNKVRRNRMKRIEKLVQEWLMPWTATAASSGEPQSNFMDSFVASYYDLISFLFKMF